MIEKIADFDLLLECARDLKRSGFRPGIDDMSGDGAVLWLTINRDKLIKQMEVGAYEPMPILCRHLAKRDGKTRLVGRATAIDTVIQRAAVLALTEKTESLFSPYSYAYRQGRGVSSALEQYCEYASRFRVASKLDFIRCFDNIDHAVLRKTLSEFTEDEAATELVMKFVTSPEYIEGDLVPKTIGLHQGIPLSPLLCNIYMHTLDVWLMERSVPFIRYADDIVLFGDNISALSLLTQEVESFVQNELKLVSNTKKTNITSSSKLVYLGHRFSVDSNGLLSVSSSGAPDKIYYQWNKNAAYAQPHHAAQLLQDGILRQKDFTVLFDTETKDYSLPIQSVDYINIYSNVVFDTEFLKRSLKSGVPVNIFDSETSEYVGSFLPNTKLRSEKTTYEQMLAYHDPLRRLSLAKEFVLAANHNIKLNLRYYLKHREASKLQSALSALEQHEEKIKVCDTLEHLLLLEAQSKAEYYSCFDLILQTGDLLFLKRSRRPPRNEVNAMISFGNTMLYNMIAMEINRTPLDVRIGFLHAANSRLNSLNLDMADVFKPLIVDRTVFSLINKRVIRPLHFETKDNGAVYMNAEGKRIFIRAVNKKMNSTISVGTEKYTYHMLICREVRKLIRYFRNTEKYKAYRQVR